MGVGEKTQNSLNIPVTTRIAQIRANMERWRHMPEDFPPDRYAVVNIPDYTLAIYENGDFLYQKLSKIKLLHFYL